MSSELLPKLGLTLAGLGAAGYLGLGMYPQPLATHRQIEPIHTFLSRTFRAPDADCPRHWLGTWEYRQRAGDGYDNEGERLELSCTGGSLQGLYFGLEREGEHGLFYTLVEMTDLKLGPEGELSFTVPERGLFHARPRDPQEVRQKKLRSAGFTRDELHMRGKIKAGTIILTCTSNSASCPEGIMVFRKGAWSGPSRP